ncbi:MAG: sigma-54-dependent Fis family transcriptional regulator, partial [Bacteroidota bacterium]
MKTEGESTPASEMAPLPIAPEQLVDLAFLLGQHSDFEEMIRLASTTGLSLFHADAVSFVMLNPQTRHTQKTIAQAGTGAADRHLHLLHTSVIGWSLRNQTPFLTPDITRDQRFSKTVMGESTARSVMCVPLRLGGAVIGHVIVLTKGGRQSYTAADLLFLGRFAAICSPYLGNGQALGKHFAAPIPDDALMAAYAPLGLIGRSKEFRVLLKAIRAASQCDVRVFIEGESGTGKEVIARAIHSSSNRSSQRFVAIDCGAIPAPLIESELFGHVKGAFTGATATRRGLFEEADGGTFFLDEITNLSIDMQAKLLRVLQAGEVRAVGSNQARMVDLRIIAATSANAWRLVEQKQFREDLFYRLHVFPILVPTLNARSDDIPLLATHFVKRFALEQHKPIESLDPALLQFMRQRKWRGNVRELENFIERVVTLAPSGTVAIDHTVLPPEIAKEYKAATMTPSSKETRALREMLAELEQEKIREALERCHWNQS